MSSNLVYELPLPNGSLLSTALKLLLRARYGEPVDQVLVHGRDYEWLQGVQAAGSGEVKDDAKKLCDLIDRYESVRVRESYG